MSVKDHGWTTPATIHAQLRRLWESGQLLSAHISGEALFPLTLNVRQPGAASLGEQFDEVRRWIRQLEEGSKAGKGYGYLITWRDINHRQLGRNRLPEKVVLAEEADALRLISRSSEMRRFQQLAAANVACFSTIICLAGAPDYGAAGAGASVGTYPGDPAMVCRPSAAPVIYAAARYRRRR